MKKFCIYTILLAVSCSCFFACGFLDVDQKVKVEGDDLFTTEAGIDAYVAGLYKNLPMEEFLYSFCNGFWVWRPGTVGASNMQAGFEAAFPHYNDHAGEEGRFNNWEQIYKSIRLYCEFKDNIEKMEILSSEEKQRLQGEQAFMMAYSYFALARRYGGVPIITEAMEFNGDYDALRVDRAKEVDTWKFILGLFDDAIALLPDEVAQERANKWSALALKSRAALFAASVGKYWNKDNIGLTGQAVSEGLVGGFTTEDINFFYQECIDACAQVITSGKFALEGAEPASLEEAAENYRLVFVEPEGKSEAMFVRYYSDPGFTHNFGKNLEPYQISSEWGGRCNVTLDMVESYQTIDPETRAGTYDVKLNTTEDGFEDYDCVTAADVATQMSSHGFIKYDDWSTIYANRDPRLYASVILPYTQWGPQNTTIVIQGGIIGEDGGVKAFKSNDAYEFNGTTYTGLGNADTKQVSGFFSPNCTMSGFLLKKYLRGDGNDQVWDKTTTPFVDIRYAEVLMNYAEAVAESGLSSTIAGAPTASEAMNSVRKRAGFLDTKEPTVENIRRERRSEFGLEYYSTVWDYVRLREFHQLFNNSRKRMGLVPMLDFTTGEPKHIFVRSNTENANTARYFQPKVYYRPIPGIDNNHLTQNPNY